MKIDYDSIQSIIRQALDLKIISHKELVYAVCQVEKESLMAELAEMEEDGEGDTLGQQIHEKIRSLSFVEGWSQDGDYDDDLIDAAIITGRTSGAPSYDSCARRIAFDYSHTGYQSFAAAEAIVGSDDCSPDARFAILKSHLPKINRLVKLTAFI